jgi:hypothetical protein
MRQTLRSADPSRFAVWAQALLNGSNQLWLSDLAGGRRTTYQIYECAFRLRPGAQRNLQRTLRLKTTGGGAAASRGGHSGRSFDFGCS